LEKVKMKKALLILAMALSITACTSVTDANKALEAEGYTDITLTGYDWFSCSKDDTYHTGFVAKNREGKTVTGTVCSGLLFKGYTIRY
jgi:starvation-inducible outer membrane lipoprotein